MAVSNQFRDLVGVSTSDSLPQLTQFAGVATRNGPFDITVQAVGEVHVVDC